MFALVLFASEYLLSALEQGTECVELVGGSG
jgi:hypothetical protein